MRLMTVFGRLPAAIDPAWIPPARVIPLTRNILRGVLRAWALADLRTGVLLLAPLAA